MDENKKLNVTEKAENPGIYVHKLKSEFTYEGSTYAEMTFNFNKLTGQEMLEIEREMSDQGEFAILPEISINYLSRLAAKSSGIHEDIIRALPLPDFSRICQKTKNFMNSAG